MSGHLNIDSIAFESFLSRYGTSHKTFDGKSCLKMTNKKYLKEVLRNLTPLLKISKSKRSAIIPLLSDELKNRENEIRIFARPTSSLLRKRKILANEQTGGGIFTILASTIIPAIIAALSK
jgi:hypothetical protein